MKRIRGKQNPAAGECWWEYMVQKQVRTLSAYYHGGTLSDFVAGTLESLVTNADGTTS